MAGAGFGGPLLICLLKLTLYKKSLAHSLQFGLKYHASSASLRAQITEHTEYNYVTAALYYVGAELEKMMRTDRQRTDRQRIQLQRPLLSPVDRARQLELISLSAGQMTASE